MKTWVAKRGWREDRRRRWLSGSAPIVPLFFLFFIFLSRYFSQVGYPPSLSVSLSRTERERTGLADSLVYKKEWQWHKKGGGGNMEPAKKGHESPTNDGRMPAASASAQDDVVLYMGEVASVSHCNRLDPPSSSCKNP